ncbi:hypothetical protein J7U46_21220 [Pelomonas sp. V22]|uniref:hypothetical protein n=1 Tax=Pelomonas sp. V22 TaxID=2822139 RepID=UPI0024A7D579|nr:hypothetical protein [Pelomonas sp. V22]MDI4635599.1 hypothetical protein [Pelomonas sp. V22]
MRTTLTAAITLLVTALPASSAWAQSYQIGSNVQCQEQTQGWFRHSGSCNQAGQLQGKGIASMGDMLLIGEFANGLPDGPQHVFHVRKPKEDLGQQINSTVESAQRVISRANGKPFERRGLACLVNFREGQPADNTIACNGVVAKARTGSVRMVKVNGRVRLEMDEADIAGQSHKWTARTLAYDEHGAVDLRVSGHHVDVTGTSQYRHDPFSLSGTAQAASLGVLHFKSGFNEYIRATFDLKAVTGTLVSPQRRQDWPHHATTPTLSVAGRFDFQMENTSAAVLLNSVRPDKTSTRPLTSDYIYRLQTPAGNFMAAFYEHREQWRQSPVHYFKSDSLEFDASGYELCLRQIYSNSSREAEPLGTAFISTEQISGRDYATFEIGFVPRCGKVTDKSGRSFAGLFDSKGRPLPN